MAAVQFLPTYQRDSGMKYLVYCVLRGDVAAPAEKLPAGVGAEKVSIAAYDGLAAVYSAVPETYAAPEASQVMAYAGVIKAFHDVQVVLPMRYGCLLESEAQIVELLQRQARQFESSLGELDGCVEMGVRVLLVDEGASTLRNLHCEAGPLSGKAYIALRAAYYAEKDSGLRRSASVAQNVRRALDGFFVRCESQRSLAARQQLLSLSFLVRRQQLQSFREAFRQLQRRSSPKVLLTGPWPPYSFVPPLDVMTRPMPIDKLRAR